MSASIRRPLGLRLAMVAAGVTLAVAPAVIAAPMAYASITTPPPLSEEPPGGATCAPDLPPTDCQQEGGASASPTPVSAATTSPPTPAATPRSSASTTSTGTTGSTGSATGLPTTLAATGPAQSQLWGSAGAGLLVLGGGLVLAARPRRARIEG